MTSKNHANQVVSLARLLLRYSQPMQKSGRRAGLRVLLGWRILVACAFLATAPLRTETEMQLSGCKKGT